MFKYNLIMNGGSILMEILFQSAGIKTEGEPMTYEIAHDRDCWRLENGELVKNSRHEDERFVQKGFNSTDPYPAVHKLLAAPLGGTGAYRMTAEIWAAICAKNTPEALVVLCDIGSGFFNAAGNDAFVKLWGHGKFPVDPAEWPHMPIAQSIITIGAEVEIVETINDSHRIKAVGRFSRGPFDWYLFTSIAPNGDIGNAPEGVECQLPIVTKTGWAWLPKLAITTKKEEPMSRPHGIDISKWNTSFDPPVSPPLPIDFVIQRLSYAGREDERVAELNVGVQQIPIRGAYHYFSSGLGWRAQADLFLGLVAKYGPFHFFALDFEKAYNKKSAGFALDAKQWIDYIAQKTGKKVVLYTNPSTYREWLMPYTNWMTAYPLWIAQYYWFPSHTKNPNMTGMDRSDWDIYQYRSNGNGRAYGVGSLDVDLNVYNGSFEQLEQWLKIHPEIPTEDCEQAIIDAEKRGVQIGINKSRDWIDTGAVSDGYN